MSTTDDNKQLVRAYFRAFLQKDGMVAGAHRARFHPPRSRPAV